MTTADQPPGFVADVSEAHAFLAAHPNVEFFEVFFTGISGVPRGKRLRRHELIAVYEYGRFLPGSVAVVDITGQDVEQTGLVWEDGDADRRARPVPGGIVPAPWLGDDVAQVMMSLHELDGTLNELDPRAVLSRVIDRFRSDGMIPVVACELEFYLLGQRRGRDGGLCLPRGVSNSTQVYGLVEIEEAAPFLRDLWATADVQSVPLEGVISECAPGQLELTLKHRADALRAADETVLYKRLAKGVARNHDCTVTFMPKPWRDRAGSGFHLHVSVEDANGSNLMADDAPEGSLLLRHAIGGMKAVLAESLAFFAPGMNSFRRFKANSYAPTAPTWGINNRTVALRVPAGSASSRHIEHRVAGADANPYLAVAVMLAGVHYGIVNKIDPGEPVVGDGYAAAAAMGASLPTNWFDAVRYAERSDILREYLGDRFVDMYVTVKRAEQERYFAEVPNLDYDWYLHNA